MALLSKVDPDVITPHYAGWVLNFTGADEVGPVTRVNQSGVMCLAGFRAVYMMASADINPSLNATSLALDVEDLELRVPFPFYDGATLNAGSTTFDDETSAKFLLRQSFINASGATNPVEMLNGGAIVPNMAANENAGFIADPVPPFLYIKLGDDILPDQTGSDVAKTGTIHVWAVA